MVVDTVCIEGKPVNKTWLLVEKICPKIKAAIYTVRLTKRYELRFGLNRCLDWGYKDARFTSCHKQLGNQRTLYNVKHKVRLYFGACLSRICSDTYSFPQKIALALCDK